MSRKMFGKSWAGGWLALAVAAGAAGTLDARASAPPGRYTITNGTVYDTVTHLTWQQAVQNVSYAWSSTAAADSGQAYCQDLSLGGFSSGWRLPTMKELVSLVDVTAHQPTIDSTAFPNTPSYSFLASSPCVVQSGAFWVVDFDTGVTACTGGQGCVRCVR